MAAKFRASEPKLHASESPVIESPSLNIHSHMVEISEYEQSEEDILTRGRYQSLNRVRGYSLTGVNHHGESEHEQL